MDLINWRGIYLDKMSLLMLRKKWYNVNIASYQYLIGNFFVILNGFNLKLYFYRSTSCSQCKVHFPTCIASGRSIVSGKIWFCNVCRHPASERKMNLQVSCPLCHSSNDKN